MVPCTIYYLWIDLVSILMRYDNQLVKEEHEKELLKKEF